jgi:hypothetical protein
VIISVNTWRTCRQAADSRLAGGRNHDRLRWPRSLRCRHQSTDPGKSDNDQPPIISHGQRLANAITPSINRHSDMDTLVWVDPYRHHRNVPSFNRVTGRWRGLCPVDRPIASWRLSRLLSSHFRAGHSPIRLPWTNQRKAMFGRCSPSHPAAHRIGPRRSRPALTLCTNRCSRWFRVATVSADRRSKRGCR